MVIMSKDWSALVDSGKIEELTNSDLKAYLKVCKAVCSNLDARRVAFCL